MTLMLGAGCHDSLGDCDPNAAKELVYSRSGLVATKGQALMNDSCGQGAFCHSSAAQGDARSGAPAGMDFDVLPKPTALGKIVSMREKIWDQVHSGGMPPKGYEVGDGDWSFDVERRPESPKLPPLSTDDGKAALRNWLACGAPSVADTTVPSWAKPALVRADESAQTWTSLHDDLRGSCVSQGCHDGLPDDASVPGALPVPLLAEECVVYRWLLFNRDQCGERIVVGGDPASSALVARLEQENPACGTRMPPPPAPKEDGGLAGRVRAWVSAGALAPQCGDWSERAPRAAGLDAGMRTPSMAPSWKDLYASVLAPRCATAGCHDAKSAASAGNLDLSDVCRSLIALLNEKGPCGQVRVILGDPTSLLVRKVESGTPSCGTLMPPPSGGLPADQVQMIRDWVAGSGSAPECP
ncbi:MAG TPA: hypothetical protein VG963_18930 [Polyangiaceae bacterium]|nr:hypothetical protein [Polyangiaceae bacterium]